MTEELLIDGDSLTVEEAYAVAVDRLRVGLSPRARARMLRTRAVVDDIVSRNAVVYGVTTGFGKLSEIAIPPDRLAELQVNLVRSHSSGVGDRLPERSEEHTSELQSHVNLVCRLLLEKKNQIIMTRALDVIRDRYNARDD